MRLNVGLCDVARAFLFVRIGWRFGKSDALWISLDGWWLQGDRCFPFIDIILHNHSRLFPQRFSYFHKFSNQLVIKYPDRRVLLVTPVWYLPSLICFQGPLMFCFRQLGLSQSLWEFILCCILCRGPRPRGCSVPKIGIMCFGKCDVQV